MSDAESSILNAISSSQAAALATQTILGCPYATYLSFESKCTGTLPACLNTTSINYNSACCSSMLSYDQSVLDCYSKNKPACLDTSAVYSLTYSSTASITGATAVCAQYATMPTGGAAATATGAAASGANASSSPSPKSAAPKVGAGLKVYVGIALLCALTVLSL